MSEVCANCGKEGHDANDDAAALKLKNCTACLLVKYCGVDCQKAHRKQHKKACKLRAAELDDEKLYTQGHERPEFDFCPLCFLAIPFRVGDHAKMRECCMKLVCDGCCLAAFKQGLVRSCPFCRTPVPGNDEESLGMVQKRVDARDPEAIRYLGDLHYHGKYGLEKNVPRAVELWSEAAELGSTTATFNLGFSYVHGRGVALDKAKGLRYWESAAINGGVESRHLLGVGELIEIRKHDRALRHFLISAKMGFKESLDEIKKMFANGHATKAQYVEGLKGYQDAVEEMKSPERDEAVTLGV